ncbi:MAG TPA: sugar isomerase [Mycobacteriales bacterium]|nr:sugar isomerase [Mycobacteriales bacterium]
MTHVENEIASQPDCWREVLQLRPQGLPRSGERVAVIGCGTSLFMAQAYAGLREAAGQGETDAFAASEFPFGRRYDRVVALTRSGTTTEVLAALNRIDTPTLAVTADPKTPVMQAADEVVVLEFADEQSVVQTRFATTALLLLRSGLGEDLSALPDQAQQAIDTPLPEGYESRSQYTFLGTGWAVGIANEAALKMREAAGAWTESYPAMEYRHGPFSITDEKSLVWTFGAVPDGLPDEIRRTGAQLVLGRRLDPIAELIGAQRLAIAVATAKGNDPDHPRNLSRSVILTGQ